MFMEMSMALGIGMREVNHETIRKLTKPLVRGTGKGGQKWGRRSGY